MDLDIDGQQRLLEYFDTIGFILKNKKRQASFALYAFGLLGDGERKSVEPIAARCFPEAEETDAAHQRLLHFLVDSDWSDREVRREASRYALSTMVQREPVQAWIIDDTGFLKQGRHSVGVQRQYTGSAGKVTNCQIGVSLSVSTRSEQLPVDFELYLPKSWTSNRARRREARIPSSVRFKTKPELALEMIDRALGDGIPPGLVLADSFYGNSSDFRDQLRQRGLDYAVGVDGTTKVWRVDSRDQRRGPPLSLSKLAQQIVGEEGFRRVTWREGTKRRLSARFAVRRVLPVHNDGWDPDTERERVWLICEWPDEDPRPSKFYFFATLETLSKKQMIRRIKQRWRTERIYEDLKGELGLDHYEGRRYPGWHHHVSAVLCCYAFIVAEHVRRFPPSARGEEDYDSNTDAARAPLRGFLHHDSTQHLALHCPLASSVPLLSSMEPSTINPSAQRERDIL
jgi:SRSO17 transposase